MSRLAEQSIIGSLLIDIDSISAVYEKLKPEMFQVVIYQKSYLEIVRMYDTGEKANLVNLAQRLKGYGFSEENILKELRECIGSATITAEIKSHANVLAKDFRAAKLSQILNAVRVSPADIDNQIGLLINDLESLKESERTRLKGMDQIVKENENNHFIERETDGLILGFPRLDEMLVELEKGDVTVIGARPAVGKSAFVTQIIRNLSAAGKRGAFYNLEMSEKQIYERMLSAETGINLKRIRKAKAYWRDEHAKVSVANNKIGSYKVMIRSGAVKVSEIRSECRHLEIDYLVIDYLQLIRSDIRYANRVSEVGDISKSIKAMAMELGVHVFLLSQLNRASEMKSTKEPTMAELRESGDVEQDASAVILIWNTSEDDYSRKGAKIEKNRQGELGKVPLLFNGATMKFSESDGEVLQSGGRFKKIDKTPFD